MAVNVSQQPQGRSLTGGRFGSYEILSLLGAGGMGEVYRAKDTTLGREVAIKVLPNIFAGNADRRAHFEREARLLAALNHPHIGAIYGLEESGGVRGLVLELVEGETLAARLQRTAGTTGAGLPLTESLTVGRQVAEALEAAHAKGIVHRDLKPANIILQGAVGPTPTRGTTAASSSGIPTRMTGDINVKVLDFGLAKVFAVGDVTPEQSQMPTVIATSADAGVVAGTPAYMSPEQARGKPVDKRTDIWAFGCVLYETLSGRRAFDGETISDTIARVIEREPDWDTLPAATPAKIRDLLKRCLQKDPTRRLHDIADARIEIEEVLSPRPHPHLTLRLATVGGVTLAAVVAVGAFLWVRSDRRAPAGRSEWVQLTRLSDAATQPALSPDGRMLAFIRGPGTFTTDGQIYVKLLPNGEPVPLTRDTLSKMSPVFSPDGARIAYTVRDEDSWDTWSVSALRGEPRRWLRNASGLNWIGPNQLLFSEIKTGIHMGIVMSSEDRSDARDVYLPPQDGMAHRSYPSPDGKWVLVVEMDEKSAWLPCRLVPVAGGGSVGRPNAPPGAGCTSAAWAPDGTWMYVTANAGDGFHIWRQASADSSPEQITSDPITEEEGLAMHADGRSVITSAGVRQRAVWVHDASGDRQISAEGYAYWPLFSADGTRLYYRITTGADSGVSASELWMADLANGRNERVLPGLTVTGFDLSRDDRVVASVLEADGKTRLWLAWLDGRTAPTRIPAADGDMPAFGASGEVFFRATEGNSLQLFGIREDGTRRQKITEGGVLIVPAVSPDGEWVTVSSGSHGQRQLTAYSTRGAAPVHVYAGLGRLRWSRDGKRVYLSIAAADGTAFAAGRTYVLPLPAGSMLPRVPAGGFRGEAEIAALPGVEVLPYGDLAPGPSAAVYAFSRITVTRNLYRIPLR